MIKVIRVLLIVSILGIWSLGQSAKKAPVPITNKATQQNILTSWQAIQAANKDLQIAILKARVECGVTEDWPIDLDKWQFNPPELKKE